MNQNDFNAVARDLQIANGLDAETARHYLSLIGDIHETDAAGKVLVRDEQGHELARLCLTTPETGQSPNLPT